MLGCKNLASGGLKAIHDRPSSAASQSLLNIVRFSPVRYYQISSVIAETALYSRLRVKERKRGSVRLQFGHPGQPRWFSGATKKALVCSHNRSLQFYVLCTIGGNRARLDARTEFEISQRSPKGEADRAHHCTPQRRLCVAVRTSLRLLWQSTNGISIDNCQVPGLHRVEVQRPIS